MERMTVPSPIDFDAIRRTVDLRRFVVDAFGPAGRNRRWPCPIHHGDGPNFAVNDNRWRCWKCGESGDIFDLIMKLDGCTLIEAAAKIDPTVQTPRKNSSATRRATPAARVVQPVDPNPPTRQNANAAAWRNPDWQAALDRFVTDSAAALWGRSGRAALDWLRARGLDDQTISRFRLGFNPVAGHRGNAFVPRGITIPWVAPGACYEGDDLTHRWVGCNVRRLPEGDVSGKLPEGVDKYLAFKGSERGHAYPWPEATMPGLPGILAEGEFDSLVGWQEAGWVANVASFGGAGQSTFHDDARAFLATCPEWLLMFDQDKAGDDAARRMMRQQPHRCRRLALPEGVNDLTDLHRSGVSVLDWLRAEWARFGWNMGRTA
jgi:DNA primase